MRADILALAERVEAIRSSARKRTRSLPDAVIEIRHAAQTLELNDSNLSVAARLRGVADFLEGFSAACAAALASEMPE